MKSDVGTSNFDINAQKKNLSVICTENDNFANIDPLENRRLAMKKLEAKLEQLRGKFKFIFHFQLGLRKV